MKESGNTAYKCKNFDEALNWYTKAAQLDPTDMTFLTNKAGKYQKLSWQRGHNHRLMMMKSDLKKVTSDWRIFSFRSCLLWTTEMGRMYQRVWERSRSWTWEPSWLQNHGQVSVSQSEVLSGWSTGMYQEWWTVSLILSLILPLILPLILWYFQGLLTNGKRVSEEMWSRESEVLLWEVSDRTSDSWDKGEVVRSREVDSRGEEESVHKPRSVVGREDEREWVFPERRLCRGDQALQWSHCSQPDRLQNLLQSSRLLPETGWIRLGS